MGKKSKAEPKPVAAPPSPSKQPAAAASNGAAEAASAAPSQPLSRRLLPEGGLLPWWVVLLFSVYALLQIGLTLEHPCAVLGVWTGMKRTQVLKAYRSLSMCCHPDKLTGLSAENVQRGELLFKRASTARDQMLAQLRESAAAAAEAAAAADAEGAAAAASCSTQLDTAIVQTLGYVLGSAVETGAYSMLESTGAFFYALCTFQYDVSMTISLVRRRHPPEPPPLGPGFNNDRPFGHHPGTRPARTLPPSPALSRGDAR
jgi:hypothetical protein